MKVKCDKCGRVDDTDNYSIRDYGEGKTIALLKDLDFERVGWFCEDCYSEEESKLKDSRYVETYKNTPIYTKHGKYSPYWQSSYYFKSISDVKARVDNVIGGIGLY